MAVLPRAPYEQTLGTRRSGIVTGPRAAGTRAPVVLPAALMAAMVILDAVSATRTLSAEEGCRARLGLADVWTILI
jgi:hypothetical protein